MVKWVNREFSKIGTSGNFSRGDHSYCTTKSLGTNLTLYVKDVVTGFFKKCWNKPSEGLFFTYLELFMDLLLVRGIFENNK